MKFLQFLKGCFTKNIPLKLIALVLAVFCVIVIGAVTAV